MPRRPRLDWPGALHHVWSRGIEKRDLFLDDADRLSFVRRARSVLADAGCRCFAWSLMDNHHHFGLESGEVPLSRVLRRINGPYATEFNRRHDRAGHLFQGRFGSRVIEPGESVRELIAYVHLNPVGAPLVPDVTALTDYPWTGHRALMGREDDGIIDVDWVLGLFGCSRARAREEMVHDLRDRLRRRSTEGRGGIDAEGVVSLPRRTQHDLEALGVTAIVGRTEYVDRVTREADERAHLRCSLEARGWDLDALVRRACQLAGADAADLRSGRRTRPEARARALVAYAACGYLRVPYAPVARRLGVSRRAIIGCAARGRTLLRSLGVPMSALLT